MCIFHRGVFEQKTSNLTGILNANEDENVGEFRLFTRQCTAFDILIPVFS